MFRRLSQSGKVKELFSYRSRAWDDFYSKKKFVVWRVLDKIFRRDIFERYVRTFDRLGDDLSGKSILDIGCGRNSLVRRYGNGVGIDIYPWKGVDIVCDTSNLPFAESDFDRIFFIASLNHVPQRELVLNEACRVLKPGGLIIITMIGPKIGFLWHKLGSWFWDKDQKERGMKKGEVGGLSKKEMEKLLVGAGFKEIFCEKFELGLNNIYIAQKPINK